MKKTIRYFLFFILFFSFFAPLPERATAENSSFYRVIDNKTAFFREANTDSLLFFLPYSYYVDKIGEYGEFYHVEIYGKNLYALDGYVLKEKLFFDGLSVSAPYPEIKIKTAYSAVLYEDENLSIPLQYLFKDREMNFYGEYLTEDGERIYFVDYNGKLGYVKEELVHPFEIPLHENPLTFIKEPDPAPKTESAEKEDSSYIYKVSIIGCLIIAGGIGLIAVLSKKKREKPVIYPEEETE